MTSSVGLELANIAPLPAVAPAGAIVVVPGSAASVLGEDGPIEDPRAEAAEERIVEWLRCAIRPGHRLVSICSGALLAGRAGLLDGHRCTTHHSCCAELARLAPRADVVEDRLYVEDGDRLSSAGVTAGIDLMLHIVGGLAGPGCAVKVARYLVVYLRRGGADRSFPPGSKGAATSIPSCTARRTRSPRTRPGPGRSATSPGRRMRARATCRASSMRIRG